MKIEYAVFKVGRDRPTKTFDTPEEAEEFIKSVCEGGVMGTVEFIIQKIYSNKR